MSITKPRGRTIDGLSLRGFCWAVGSGFVCVEAGAGLVLTLVIGIVAYVKGA